MTRQITQLPVAPFIKPTTNIFVHKTEELQATQGMNRWIFSGACTTTSRLTMIVA